jgi:hypothetical protein
MSNPVKSRFLDAVKKKFGTIRKLPNSQSLFDLTDGGVRIYIRYSKVHEGRDQSFFGLRKADLKLLGGKKSLLCFIWDVEKEPLIVPFEEFEEVFASVKPASDGQYKVQVYHGGTAEMYIASAGRFGVEGHMGWGNLERAVDRESISRVPDFGHSQIQTLLGAIGSSKGYDIWIPQNDRGRLDWSLTSKFRCRDRLPDKHRRVREIIGEVDVVWMSGGSGDLNALFEVEHSTPIYTALLRFNDILLSDPRLRAKFNIVSNEVRRSSFLKQIMRPTFSENGLADVCNFLDYRDVYSWYNRTSRGRS